MGTANYSEIEEVKTVTVKAKATEIEYLKYLYENLSIDELAYLTEGFKADTGKDLPDGYEVPEYSEDSQEDWEDFWDEEHREDCGSCPHSKECGKEND